MRRHLTALSILCGLIAFFGSIIMLFAYYPTTALWVVGFLTVFYIYCIIYMATE